LPDTSKLEKLNRELEKSEKKLRKAINDEKALQHQLKQLTRKERTHRLCTRGGMLESFLQEPERLTDDDVMLLLTLIFHRQDTQELLKKLLEREKPDTDPAAFPFPAPARDQDAWPLRPGREGKWRKRNSI
jgi:nickel-dependent lactate racemase